MKKFLSILLLLVLTTSLHAQAWYVNPVIDQSLPDPTVIRVGQAFYLYATENTRNTPIYTSRDLVHWSFVGTCFTNETRPQMVPAGNIWAPDINRIGDRYVLYYSKSTWGGEWECGIGVATAEKPEGPFTDVGKLFISSEIGVQNSIDPFYIEDHGRKYLFWGSFRGIYGIELTDDGLHVREGAAKVQIAGTLTEGTYIHYREGYYYLIGSAGTCCEGERSTYRLVVARAQNLLGPYLDKQGGTAMQNHFELLLHRNGEVIGPGHCSEIVQDDAGQDWILYHGFDAQDIHGGRKVYLDRIVWDDDGWPTIDGQVPSANAAAPQFGENAGR